jgi:hypothetical protein
LNIERAKVEYWWEANDTTVEQPVYETAGSEAGEFEVEDELGISA